MPADFNFVKSVGLALPGVAEGTSYGTPALKARGKLFARLREDGSTLVVASSFEDREFLMTHHPAVFHITDHYRDYPWVLVHLKKVGRLQLREVLEDAWRRVAPKSLVKAHDERRGR